MLLRLLTDFRRAMDLSLVLDEEGIAHEVRSVSDTQWALFADDAAAERAEKALQAFERENPPALSQSAPEEPLSDAGILAGGSSGPARSPPPAHGSSAAARRRRPSCAGSGGAR